MKRAIGILGFLLLAAGQPAQAADEDFCQVPADCVDDHMEIFFPAASSSIIENVAVDQEIDMQLRIDAKSAVAGYSYGVESNPAELTVTAPTHKGATIHPIVNTASGEGGADIKITRLGEGGIGFIQAIVMTNDDQPPFELPLEDNITTATAKYKAKAIPAGGAKVFVSNEVKPPGSPKTATNLTIGGKSKKPKKVDNGLVKSVGGPVPCAEKDFAFFFGPAASATEFDVAGAANAKISMRNKSVTLGFSLAIKKAADKLTFEHNALGSPLVELVITKEDATEVNGDVLKGNSAKGATNDITAITKGAAIAAVAGDGLFVRILAAGVDGGPGATVGYVVDATGNGATIPAVTDPASGCAVHEVLDVAMGGVVVTNLSRGDANGDKKLNVTDGVVVAQNIFAATTRPALVFFDCKDMLDVNDDGTLNAADPVFLLNYIFLKGPTPPAPFGAQCGPDTTPDAGGVDLGCNKANC